MTELGGRRGPGRPRERLLDRQRITEAAFLLVSRSGLKALTLRRIAESLDVSPSAIYNHASSRSAILYWVQEHLTGNLDVSGFDGVPLKEAMARWAWSYLRILREQPALIDLIVAVPIAHTPRTTHMYQRIVAGFVASGWREEYILPSLSVLETFIFGAALDAMSPDNVYEPQSSAASPLLARSYSAYSRMIEREGVRPRDFAFQLGLDAILDGLRLRCSSRRG